MEKSVAQLNTFARPSLLFWACAVTLFLLAVLGGSSRDDAQSLAILSPVLAVSCGIACLSMKWEHWHGKHVIFLFFAAFFLLVTMHFIQWPSLMDSGVSGNSRNVLNQGLVAQGGVLADFACASTRPQAALFFLLGPLAVTFYAIQLKRHDMVRTLPVIILYGTISGLFGVLQITGTSDGSLYLYRITNNGNAVGLFANRNHAAVFLSCMFPILAVFATMPDLGRHGGRSMRLIVAAIAILLVPLILVIGSRTGMLTALIGLVGGALLFRTQVTVDRRRVQKNSAILIGAFLVFAALVLVTVYFSRALAMERLFDGDKTTYARGDFWRSSLDLFLLYFPFGFGPGLFTQVYQAHEPIALLNARYLNLLHNDWLEIALTFGVPGILLLLAGTIYYLRRSFVLWMRMDGARSAVALGRMASIVIAILGIASMSDYPLRTPAMAGFAALVLVWFAHARREPKAG